MSKIIFALIVVASQGAEPEYEKVYATAAGCQRGAAAQVETKGAADAWCAAVEVDLVKAEN